MAGVGTSSDPKASSDHEIPKEPDTPSSCVSDPEGMPVNVCSSLNWEAVTTSGVTFRGVQLLTHATAIGVATPGGS